MGVGQGAVKDLPPDFEAGRALIAAWRTNNRVTTYLIENLPAQLWSKAIPGVPRRTVGMIAAHIHNGRCMWIKMLGAKHGIVPPRRVDMRRVRAAELLRALSRSSKGIIRLLELGIAQGGSVPRAAWQNFPTDVVHFLNYLWRTRATIVASCPWWRASWGTGFPRAWSPASGNGRRGLESKDRRRCYCGL